ALSLDRGLAVARSESRDVYAQGFRRRAQRAVHESQGQAEPTRGGDLRVPEREGGRGGGRHHEGAGHRRQRQSRFRDQEERGGDRGLEVSEVVAVSRVLLWLAVPPCSTLAASAAGPAVRHAVWDEAFDET